MPPPAARLGGGHVLSRIVFVLLVTLPGRDLRHADSVADHVGGALLALGSLGIGAEPHELSDETQQLGVLRAMPAGGEEIPDLNVGHLAARWLVGLVPDEHAPCGGIAG
jgi:hypothetical protein